MLQAIVLQALVKTQKSWRKTITFKKTEGEGERQRLSPGQLTPAHVRNHLAWVSPHILEDPTFREAQGALRRADQGGDASCAETGVARTTTQAAGGGRPDGQQDDRILLPKTSVPQCRGDRSASPIHETIGAGRPTCASASKPARRGQHGGITTGGCPVSGDNDVVQLRDADAARLRNVATAAITGTQHGGSVLRGRDSSVLVEGNIHS